MIPIEVGKHHEIKWMICKLKTSDAFWGYINIQNVDNLILEKHKFSINSTFYKDHIFTDDFNQDRLKQKLIDIINDILASYDVGGQKYTTCENIINTLSK